MIHKGLRVRRSFEKHLQNFLTKEKQVVYKTFLNTEWIGAASVGWGLVFKSCELF